MKPILLLALVFATPAAAQQTQCQVYGNQVYCQTFNNQVRAPDNSGVNALVGQMLSPGAINGFQQGFQQSYDAAQQRRRLQCYDYARARGFDPSGC